MKHKLKDMFKDMVYIWDIIGLISAIIGIYRCLRWIYKILSYNYDEE